MDAQPQTEDSKEYANRLETLCRAQFAEIGRLRGEVERLTDLLQGSGLDAHTFLRNVYSNPEASESARLKAAGLALNVEKARLAPQQPPLNLVGEEIEDLATLVERRRKRQRELEGKPIEIVPNPSSPHGKRVNLLVKPNGDGDDSGNQS